MTGNISKIGYGLIMTVIGAIAADPVQAGSLQNSTAKLKIDNPLIETPSIQGDWATNIEDALFKNVKQNLDLIYSVEFTNSNVQDTTEYYTYNSEATQDQQLQPYTLTYTNNWKPPSNSVVKKKVPEPFNVSALIAVFCLLATQKQLKRSSN